MVSQPDAALAAMLDGASTSREIADELGVSVKHAASVINRLRLEGCVRWTGRIVPPEPGESGHGYRVWEAVR